MFQSAWKVFRKFCPLCYKQVIALSPRRCATRAICGNFENTPENLSLILLGLMRLHIQTGFLAHVQSAERDTGTLFAGSV